MLEGKKRGFTLAEVVIASSLFVTVGVIGVAIFVDVIKVQRRVSLESSIFEDARFMMERIARDVRQNTIDYEEYYRANAGLGYGEKFGCYAQRFYDPRDDGFGAMCNDGVHTVEEEPDCVVDKTTLDINTGQNPFASALNMEPKRANAVCDKDNHVGDFECDAAVEDSDASYAQPQLFLISPGGDRKVFYGRKRVKENPDEFAVAMLELQGQDMNTDGIFEKWEGGMGSYVDFCVAGYNCGDDLTDLNTNLEAPEDNEIFVGFVPITPFRSTVKDLKFYIAPLEDPRKAFAETEPGDAIQQQPHVTIVMTVQPSASEMVNFRTDPPPTVTLQTTVSSRVYNEVKSYQGIDVCDM